MQAQRNLACIEEINSKQIQEDIIIGSLDVKALYPSLDVKFTAEIVARTFYESKCMVGGIDVDELGLYLSLNMSEEDLLEADILQYCPRRKHKKTPPVITGCATNRSKEKRFAPWKEPAEKPDNQTEIIKKMVSIALQIAIKYIMNNHIYKFDDCIKKQEKGGPIGLELTGELAGIFMSWWDRQLLTKLDKLGIKVLLYKRYVDDINIILVAPDRRAEYLVEGEEGKLVTNEENKKTCSKEESGITLLKQIGDSIHESIKLEADYPDMHEDKKLPLLDIKMWVENHKTEDKGPVGIVMYEFYAKEVSSKAVVHEKSAMPRSVKRTVLTQEVLRILLRCSPRLPWEVTTSHLNTFMMRMQYSGYDKNFRTQVLKSGLNAYENIKTKDQTGEQPMYRSKEWKRNERKKKKRQKKNDWFKKGGYKSVLFIPPPLSQNSRKPLRRR